MLMNCCANKRRSRSTFCISQWFCKCQSVLRGCWRFKNTSCGNNTYIYSWTYGYPIFGETSILQESVTYRNATLLVVEKCQTLELSKSAYFFLHEAGLLKNEVHN